MYTHLKFNCHFGGISMFGVMVMVHMTYGFGSFSSHTLTMSYISISLSRNLFEKTIQNDNEGPKMKKDVSHVFLVSIPPPPPPQTPHPSTPMITISYIDPPMPTSASTPNSQKLVTKLSELLSHIQTFAKLLVCESLLVNISCPT